MSKEIIIDGVNVAECEYYVDTLKYPDNLNGGYYIQHCYCSLQGDSYCICNKNKNCYYKQLQRLKQENEELKEKINTYVCSTNCHKYIQADKYKQALEDIKDRLIAVTEDEPKSTTKLILDLRPIIERVLNE